MQRLKWTTLEKTAIKKANGAESFYFQTEENKGIKLIRTPFRIKNGGYEVHKTPAEAMSSPKMGETMRQVMLMNELRHNGSAPIVHKVLLVIDDRFANQDGGDIQFIPAMEVEHIPYESGKQFTDSEFESRQKFLDAMTAKGYDIGDSHFENVVMNQYTGQWVIIDFGGVKRIHEHGFDTDNSSTIHISIK